MTENTIHPEHETHTPTQQDMQDIHPNQQDAHHSEHQDNAQTIEDPSNNHTQKETEVSPEEHIASLETQLQEMKDKWMRAEAEMQNLRTRSKKEIEDARQYAVQKFAKDVVEAADNLQRGLASLPPKDEKEEGLIAKLREGFESTERSFLSILERNGITRHDPVGHAFDANHHQAMQEQDSPEHAPGHIISAWTPTWLLNNRLLKPAMVIVASQNSTGSKKQ